MTTSIAKTHVKTRRSLATNSQWNLVAYACTLSANFVTIPFVVDWIGLTAFGQAGIVLAVCAPMMLIGTVLAQGVVSRMSAFLGARDEPGAKRMVDAAMRLCLIAGTGGWLLLAAVGPWLTGALMQSGPPADALANSFSIAATGWFAQQFVLVLQGISSARQDYPKIARLSAFTGLAAIGATLSITSAIPTTEGYLCGIAAGFIVSLTAWLAAMRGDLRGRRILGANRQAECRALFHFGKWQTVAQLAGLVGNQVDRYTLGALAPTAVVGQYNVAARLQEAAYIGVIKAGEVLFPHFGRIAHQNAEERLRSFLHASWLVGSFGTIALTPMAVLSQTVLTLWVGPDTAEGSALLLRTLVLAGIIGCSSDVFSYYAMGIGRNAPVAVISVCYSVLTVVFTVLLIRAFGPYAAGGGVLAASMVRASAILAVTRREFFPGAARRELLVSNVLPMTIGIGLVFGARYLNIGEARGWIQFFALYVALAVAVLTAIIVASALTVSGRQMISRTRTAMRGAPRRRTA